MSRKQGTVKLSKALSYVAIVLVLAAVCGFVAYFTSGFTSGFKSFYVECNGDTLLHDGQGYELAPSEPLDVNVKYTFSALSENVSGYSVKVMPNVDEDTDFDFTVDDGIYSFGAETDLTKGFNIDYKDESFSIAPKGQMEKVLSSVYPDSVVAVDKTKIKYDKDLFKLVITSYNGEASLCVTFKISDCMITGITLDLEEIVF